MSRPGRARTADRARPEPRSRLGLHALFYLILAILAARPLISEQYERIDLDFLEAAGTPEGPSPATTAILDSVLLIAGSVALATGGRWRRAGRLGLTSAIVLFAAVLVSSLAADDRQVALLAGMSLCAALLAGFALWTLCSERWMRALVLAGLLATGGALTLKSIRQCTDEWYATREFWEQEYKPALLEQGYRDDDRLIINFERRMLAREAHGYAGHPNINASLLAQTGVVAAGVAIAALASGSSAGGLAGLAFGAAVAVAGWFTGSLGAAAAAVAGLSATFGFGRWGARLALRPGVVLLALAAGYYIALGGVAAYGISKGTLPHPSLEFRWHYWTAAGQAYAEAPLTGIGRLNFAAAYMRLKSPASIEEVRDPHNLWVSLIVELGPLGLASGLLIFGLLTRRAIAALAPPPEPDTPPAPEFSDAARRGVPLFILLAIVHAAFSATPFAVPGIPLTWAFDILIPWGIVAFTAFVILSRTGATSPGPTWIAAGILGALIVALTHGTLDFALMTPGGIAFLALLAAAIGGTSTSPAAPPRLGRQAAALTLAALAAGHVVFVTIPAARSALLGAALEREIAQRGANPVPQKWRALAAADGDAALRRRVIRTTLAGLRNCPFTPRECRDLFVWTEAEAARLAADQPRNANHAVLLAEVRAARAAFEAAQSDADAESKALRAAAETWERAVELYPTNPRHRLSAGWARLQVAGDDPNGLTRARQHFVEALRIDDLRKPEEVQRLRPAERAPVEAWLHGQAP